MSFETNTQEFVEKARLVSLEVLRTINIETINEPSPMDMKIALFALTKISASVIYALSRDAEDSEEVLDLFVNTVLGSVRALGNIEDSKEAADDVINKLRGMK